LSGDYTKEKINSQVILTAKAGIGIPYLLSLTPFLIISIYANNQIIPQQQIKKCP
jgi:hypothetical protein